MSGPLTDTETAQIIDHLGYDNISAPSRYVEVYVKPQLAELSDEAVLAVIRGHLDSLNAIYAELKAVISKFKLSEVKGIVFNDAAEGRLWGMYCMWAKKLAAYLCLQPNPEVFGSRTGRPIV